MHFINATSLDTGGQKMEQVIPQVSSFYLFWNNFANAYRDLKNTLFETKYCLVQQMKLGNKFFLSVMLSYANRHN